MGSRLIENNRHFFLKLQSNNNNQFVRKTEKEKTDKHIVSGQSTCTFAIYQLLIFMIEVYNPTIVLSVL